MLRTILAIRSTVVNKARSGSCLQKKDNSRHVRSFQAVRNDGERNQSHVIEADSAEPRGAQADRKGSLEVAPDPRPVW